ncbi:hypothetical protein [Leucobacter luti]|uniref:hypothetical protein n=1 Tax=Leucobacter luti TaxID=340320 RepID=UPI00105F51E7|nr:hypothetical protein [Leucobacter luti]
MNGREFTILPLVHDVVAPEFPLPKLSQYNEYFSDGKKIRELDEAETESVHEAELSMWTRLWAKPQAAMWSRLGLPDQVAAYVRAYMESTGQNSNSRLKTAAIRMEAELGISTSGMLQNGWVIEVPAADGVASVPSTSGGEKKRQTSTGTWSSGVKVEQA